MYYGIHFSVETDANSLLSAIKVLLEGHPAFVVILIDVCLVSVAGYVHTQRTLKHERLPNKQGIWKHNLQNATKMMIQLRAFSQPIGKKVLHIRPTHK